MSKKLEGTIPVVTGDSAGIGSGAAKRFGEEGAKVVITGRDKVKKEAGGAGSARCLPMRLSANPVS
jgi:NAD(P)-dependent dehydrogenase (short-subunit alcohol dehydrogenase family)